MMNKSQLAVFIKTGADERQTVWATFS